MKIFFDTNVYVAEALLGETAEQLVEATEKAGWRIFCNSYLLDELQRVLTEILGFSARLGALSRRRVLHKARLVKPGASHHEVIKDIKDSPILKAALAARADYLVTNDPVKRLQMDCIALRHTRLLPDVTLTRESARPPVTLADRWRAGWEKPWPS